MYLLGAGIFLMLEGLLVLVVPKFSIQISRMTVFKTNSASVASRITAIACIAVGAFLLWQGSIKELLPWIFPFFGFPLCFYGLARLVINDNFIEQFNKKMEGFTIGQTKMMGFLEFIVGATLVSIDTFVL